MTAVSHVWGALQHQRAELVRDAEVEPLAIGFGLIDHGAPQRLSATVNGEHGSSSIAVRTVSVDHGRPLATPRARCRCTEAASTSTTRPLRQHGCGWAGPRRSPCCQPVPPSSRLPIRRQGRVGHAGQGQCRHVLLVTEAGAGATSLRVPTRPSRMVVMSVELSSVVRLSGPRPGNGAGR
jgi:hypothetical protein